MDAEQLKTRFLVPVLIIIATVWCVYSNEDLVFLSFFSHTRWWDAERTDGWMDALGAHFQVDADIVGRVAKRTSQTDMKRRKRLLPCFSIFVHRQGGGVWMYSGGKGVETQRGCWRRGGSSASVSVSPTCLITSPSSRLQTDAGAETWIRESHQRGGIENE